MVIQGRKGGGGGGHTPVESPDNLQSTATAKILLAISEGEIAGGLDDTRIFLDGTPIGNADGSKNFEGVTWEFREGSQQQEYIKGIPSVDNELSIGVELKSDSPYIRSFSNTQLSALRVRLSVPQLLQQKDNGDTVGYRVEYAIDLSTDGAGFKQVLKSAFDGKTTTEYQRSHRIDLPNASSTWQLRIRRLTPNKDSARYADRINISAISEVIDAKLRYPNTALLFVTFNAEQFKNGIPKVSVRPKGGLVIKVPSNYSTETRTYSGAWDGTFKMAASNNPAWVFYDIVTNKRYGCGDRISAAQVDKWELYRIAQYCDQLVPDGRGGDGKEPRFLCDVFIQSQEEAYTVLRDIATIFRGMTYWFDNQVKVMADMPADVFRVFTNANMVNGKATYHGGSQQNRYTQALVSYSDTNNHGSDEIEAVVDASLQRRYGVRKTKISAIGCTRQTESNRRGRWVLLTNAQDRVISFATGLEGAIPAPGHIIGVADVNLAGRKIGGRVSSAEGRKVTLDRVADAKVGDRLIINLPSGKSEGRTVQSIDDKVITVTATYSEKVEANAIWTVDADDLAIQLYRVTSIEDNNDNTYTINGVYHNPDKYAHIDTGARIDEKPITVIPPGVQPPPKDVTITSQTIVNQGIAITSLVAQWEAVDGAIAYEAEWRRDNNNWVSVPRTSSLGFDVSGIYAGRYQVRVRAINASDISSIWALAPETELKGKEGDPPPVLGFTASPLVFGIRLDWGFAPNTGDSLKTEIQYGETADIETFKLLADVPYPARSHELSGLQPAKTLHFRARLVDKLGNQSDWSEVVSGQAEFDASIIIDELSDEFLSSEAGDILQKGLDANVEGILENAAALGGTVQHFLRENGKMRAEIVEVRNYVVTETTALAEKIDIVKVTADESWAAAQNALQAKYDMEEGTASATWSSLVTVHYDGVDYDAGMVISAELKDKEVKTSIGFSADTFGVFNPASGKLEPIFFIKNGVVYMRSAFIDKAGVQELLIGSVIYSDDYEEGKKGFLIDGKTGKAEFNDVVVRGDVYAKSGHFSGDITGATGTFSGKVEADSIIGDVVASSEIARYTFNIEKHPKTRRVLIKMMTFQKKKSPVRVTLIPTSGEYIYQAVVDGNRTPNHVIYLMDSGKKTILRQNYNGSGHNFDVESFTFDIDAGNGSVDLYAWASETRAGYVQKITYSFYANVINKTTQSVQVKNEEEIGAYMP